MFSTLIQLYFKETAYSSIDHHKSVNTVYENTEILLQRFDNGAKLFSKIKVLHA